MAVSLGVVLCRNRWHSGERSFMEDRLRLFRGYLFVWVVLMLGHWLYINVVLHDHSPAFEGVWQLWHPYWFNVLYATTLVIPFLLFTLPISRWYGGTQSAVGRSVLLLGLGGLIWGLGNGVWFIYNVLGDAAPYPSLADVGFLGMLPFAAVALFSLAQIVGVTPRAYLQLAWLPLLVFAVTGYLAGPETDVLGAHVGSDWLFSADQSTLANAISGLYIVLDVLLMTFALMLALRARLAAGGVFFLPIVTVVVALISQYVADMFFFHRVADDTYFNGDFSDGLYAISMLMLVMSAYLFGRAYAKMLGVIPSPPVEGVDAGVQA